MNHNPIKSAFRINMARNIILLQAVFMIMVILTGTSYSEHIKPNIILILADDLGYSELGCYEQNKIKTPNLDLLASEGMKLTDHYSGSPVCAPSRCVLMTGKHTGHSYVRDNKELPQEGQTPIPSDSFTIATMLKAKGYTTGCVGKWGLGFPGSEGDPLNQGFDLFFGYNCQRQAHYYYPKYLWKNNRKMELPGNNERTGTTYSPDLMKKEVLNFIRENKDNPFFLYWPTPVPHVSLQVPEDSLTQYRHQWNETPYKGKHYTSHKTPRAAYAAMITRMDRDIGDLLSLLKELSLEENTLVIFTSDNGTSHAGGVDARFFNSVGKLRGLKGQLYEGGIRVPFIARWKGQIAPGTTSDHVSAFWDILPTLADIAGVQLHEDIDGITFAPTLLGKSGQIKHAFLYWEFSEYGGQVAVRMDNWKGIRRNLIKNPDAKIELYNLNKDIAEKNNLAEQHPEIVQRIKMIMVREHAPSKEFPETEVLIDKTRKATGIHNCDLVELK
jgi:arylsulfatase A-like enzyme